MRPVTQRSRPAGSRVLSGTVGTAFCLTVLVLMGVWRAKPTYLLPYSCMLLCDLVLTAGVLLTACFYIRNAREWIALQRYVDVVFKEHLQAIAAKQPNPNKPKRK